MSTWAATRLRVLSMEDRTALGGDVSVMSQGGSPETINITIEGSETVSDYDVSINASGELLIA